MVLSYYIVKYPYKLMWHISRFLGYNTKFAVYIAEPIDYIALKPVLKHLPPAQYIAKNEKVKNYLETQDIQAVKGLCFPNVLIMSRHSTYRFPEGKIFKVGFRHGAYHFKRFTKARYYNDFDLYFMTSNHEVRIGCQHGITSAISTGFPKLDPAFDGTLNKKILDQYREKTGCKRDRKTIIFTSTWDGSGMSAIEKWSEKLNTLVDRYNILVTVHPWVSAKYVDIIKKTDGVFFIDDPDILPYLMIADVMVADLSSIIAEFCALNKPIIRFKTEAGKRTVPEVVEICDSISEVISDFSELESKIDYCLSNPQAKEAERQKANKVFFDSLDGRAGKRAAEIINGMISRL